MRKRGRRSAYIVHFNINLISWISPSSCPLQQLVLRERVTPPFLRARPASAQSVSYYVIRINFTVPKYCIRKMRSQVHLFSHARAQLVFSSSTLFAFREESRLSYNDNFVDRKNRIAHIDFDKTVSSTSSFLSFYPFTIDTVCKLNVFTRTGTCFYRLFYSVFLGILCHRTLTIVKHETTLENIITHSTRRES